MEHEYKSLKFINLLYSECDLYERLELEHALLEDEHIMMEYQDLLESKKMLPQVLFQPSAESISNILAYA